MFSVQRIAAEVQSGACRRFPLSGRRVVSSRSNEMPPPGQAASYLPICASYLPAGLCRLLQSRQTHLMLASERASVMSRRGDAAGRQLISDAWVPLPGSSS